MERLDVPARGQGRALGPLLVPSSDCLLKGTHSALPAALRRSSHVHIPYMRPVDDRTHSQVTLAIAWAARTRCIYIYGLLRSVCNLHKMCTLAATETSACPLVALEVDESVTTHTDAAAWIRGPDVAHTLAMHAAHIVSEPLERGLA